MRIIAILAVLASACTAEALPPSDVGFLTGQESDLWTRQPAPVRVEVNLVSSDHRTLLAEGAAPTLDLPITNRQVPLGETAFFEANALDGSSAIVGHGSSMKFVVDIIDGIKVPIFVARTGGWSRAPDTLEHPHKKPVVLTALTEFLVAAGGEALPGVDGSVPDFYDGVAWTTLRSQPPLPRSPKSAAQPLDKMLVIDDVGASWLDLTKDGKGAVSEAMAPEGLAFSEVSGGGTVSLSDGTQLIVGATRATGDPTAKVLRVASDGTLQALALATPRRGAAAGVVGGKLVVAGGSSDGAGVEVLNDAHTAFVALGVAADPTTGLGLCGGDGMAMELVGGHDATTGAAAGIRSLDVSCGPACAFSDLGPLPSALASVRVYRIDATTMVATGESDDGETHAFRIAIGANPAVTELPLRERRKSSTATILPNGQVGLVGGVSVDGSETAVSTIEALFP